MKSNMKPQTNELVQATIKLAVAQQQLARQAEQQYSFEVDSILRDHCREPQHIERVLDGMLDFCFDDEMLRLYKKRLFAVLYGYFNTPTPTIESSQKEMNIRCTKTFSEER